MSLPRTFTPDSLLPDLQCLPIVTGYCIALSGGADSVALLVAMADLRSRLLKPIRAVHVHHGLQQAADDWVGFCHDLCQRLDIPLEIAEIEIERQPDESLEMAARRLRYAALAQGLMADEVLVTAHHLDDQAETLLLHLFRGAGVDGLAAMPIVRPFSIGVLLRPLLDWRRDQLITFLAERGFDWIEDPSNNDVSFDRNFVRHHVMPVIASRWPAAPNAIARSARLQAEQRRLNDLLAESRLVHCYDFGRGALQVERLMQLEAAWRHLLLRYWLTIGHPRLTLSLARLETLEIQLSASKALLIEIGDAQLRLFAGRLYRLSVFTPTRPTEMMWRLDRPLHIPALGVFIEPAPLLRHFPSLASSDCLRVTSRRGGERIHVAGVGHQTLKKAFQQWRVPPWLRSRLPLIWRGSDLICIPGYWVASAVA